MSVVRHYFPGNNTPKGFFSYYQHILGQREANHIVYIKGGPGTGKSTFFKKVGREMEKAGESIDYLHCSADADSLDGILLPEKKIACIDGTSPHILDPLTPGAVDEIINFGEFWNKDDICKLKDEIIENNEECSKWYGIAYNQLKAAKAIQDNLTFIQEKDIDTAEVYKVAVDVITREFKSYPLSLIAGNIKKAFLSGITSSGCINMLKSILLPIRKIYLINVPDGYRNQSFMRAIMEGAIFRGFDVEAYYCPMNPDQVIEHILIPELSLAFVTVNRWHDVEPWELTQEEHLEKTVTMIDISDFQSIFYVEENEEIINHSQLRFAQLIEDAVSYLNKAKEYHDKVEKLYIQNMDFRCIDNLVLTLVKGILS